MNEEEQKQKRISKVLFLGAGGSGKSTIFKQLQWLHGDGFSNKDLLEIRMAVYTQITSQMKLAIQYYDLFENDITDVLLHEAVSIVVHHPDVAIFSMELAEAIQYIWLNEGYIHDAFRDLELSEYQILDQTTQYFWNDLDRIKEPNYLPNERDIVCVRARTTGIIEKYFTIRGVALQMIDVGGQRCERKKWINCFDQVQAIVFVASLSCFNEMMYEDMNKNAMVDSIELFDQVINNKYFRNTHVILFLNKKDLYQQKIEQLPITTSPAFHDFGSWNPPQSAQHNAYDYSQTRLYIAHKFESCNRSKSRQKIYTHFTYALDKTNIDKVFADVVDIVLGQTMTLVAL